MIDKAGVAIAESGKTIDLITIDEVAGLPSLQSIQVDQQPPAADIDPANDVCVLPYSSGTTGLPKGVMLMPRNVVAQLHQLDAIEKVGMVIIMMHGLMRGSRS